MREFKVSSVTDYVKHIEKITPLNQFWYRGVAKTSYLPIPKLIWKNAINKEGSLEHYFLVSYKAYIESGTLNSWEIYSLMQHHGLPTRLLDWSESSLVALFFALTSEPSSTAYRVVWALNPFSLNQATTGTASVYCPAALNNKEITINGEEINIDSYLPPNLKPSAILTRPEPPLAIQATQHLKRVSSQKGCFTVHGSNPDSLNTYLLESSDFHMIKIDARTKKVRTEMLNTLNSMGINEEVIYQDLDSLCNKINREWNI